MAIIHDTLTFLELALIVLSSLSFRLTFTPPRNNSDSLSPRLIGKQTKPQQLLATAHRRGFLLLSMIALDIASLNELLFILYTEAPGNVRVPQLDVFYSRLAKASARFAVKHSSWLSFKLLLLTLSITGHLIRRACYRAFRGTFRFDFAAGGEKRPLITDGPYSVVRHPAYTGMWFVVIGIIGFHLSPGTWIHVNLFDLHNPGPYYYYPLVMAVGLWVGLVSAVSTVLVFRTKEEDELLKECFGEVWARWRSVVRYKLVPGIY